MFRDKNFLKQISLGIWLIVAFIAFYLLKIGAAIFLPLIISIFILILFYSIFGFFNRFIKNRYLAAFLSVVLFFSFFVVVGYIISTQIESFAQNTDKFEEGLTNIYQAAQQFLYVNFKVDLNNYLNFEAVRTYLGEVDYGGISRNFFGTVTNVVASIGTMSVMLFFIFLERKNFRKKFNAIFDGRGMQKFNDIIKNIYEDLNVYFVSKFFIALGNGIVATIIMSLFGLDFALMFGLLVFIFDFVPVVGGLIALGLPFLYSLVTFGSIPLSLLMLLCLNIPQAISGNIIEPKIMGERLNLSSFFLIISLLFWSMMWGILGAFLATPIMATMTIVFSKFKATEPLAVLLSQNGDIN